MQYSEPRWSRSHVEALMEIAATVADHVDSLESAASIPHYLTRILDLESLTLAIVREIPHNPEPHLFLRSSSGSVAAGDAATTLDQQILAIFQQTKPLTPADGPTLRSTLEEADAAPSQTTAQRLSAYPRATVFARSIDEQHRALLVVHHRAEDPQITPGLADLLQIVTDQLAKQLGALVLWHHAPEALGEPFIRLTDREWMVLRGLMSEAGEKQLADQLTLSPHTLHSHIKSIYRKVGVQGRLPLLSKVKNSLQQLRQARINQGGRPPIRASLAEQAVAVG